MATPNQPPRVFISYSHDSPEHGARVLALADRLRADGVDAEIDQYEPYPPEGWRMWMRRQLEAAQLVLLVCTPTYKRRFEGREEPGIGLGAQRESALIDQELYESAGRNERFIPVLFDGAQRDALPDVLRDTTRYVVGDDAGYVALLRRLTHQPEVSRPPVGARRALPPRERRSDFFAADSKRVGAFKLAFERAEWEDVGYPEHDPFVGRSDALDLLTCLPAARTPEVVWVHGDAGMGKSALLRQAALHLREVARQPADTPLNLLHVHGWNWTRPEQAAADVCAAASELYALDPPPASLDDLFRALEGRPAVHVWLLDDLSGLVPLRADDPGNDERLVVRLRDLALRSRVALRLVVSARRASPFGVDGLHVQPLVADEPRELAQCLCEQAESTWDDDQAAAARRLFAVARGITAFYKRALRLAVESGTTFAEYADELGTPSSLEREIGEEDLAREMLRPRWNACEPWSNATASRSRASSKWSTRWWYALVGSRQRRSTTGLARSSGLARGSRPARAMACAS